MILTLRIENYDTLENGGPTSISLNRSGASVGRRASMDWVLPDPAKHISGHHFDITYREGRYWIADVSTNGTFFEGQRQRLVAGHELKGGERIVMGHYIIVAELAETGRVSSVPGWTDKHAAQGDSAEHPVVEDPINLLSHPAAAEDEPEYSRLQQPTQVHRQLSQPVQRPPTVRRNAAQLSHPPFVPLVGGQFPAGTSLETHLSDNAFARAIVQSAGVSQTGEVANQKELAEAIGRVLHALSETIAKMDQTQSQRLGTDTDPAGTAALTALLMRAESGPFEDALRTLHTAQSNMFNALEPALMETLGSLPNQNTDTHSVFALFLKALKRASEETPRGY